MGKIIAAILMLLGILLVLSGLGLISFEKIFLLYLGAVLCILAFIFYLRS